MSGPTLAAVIVGGAFIAMGVMALLRPAQVLAYFGLHNLTPDLRNEVRAVYGGFGVALGMLLMVTTTSAIGGGVRVAAGISLAGMAGGRVYSWCLERTGHWPVVFALIEIAGAMGLLFELRHAPGVLS